MSSRTLPPALEPYLQLPPETSLILLTSTLGCSVNWLTARFISSALASDHHQQQQEPSPPPLAILLVSWIRDLAFWKTELRRTSVSTTKPKQVTKVLPYKKKRKEKEKRKRKRKAKIQQFHYPGHRHNQIISNQQIRFRGLSKYFHSFLPFYIIFLLSPQPLNLPPPNPPIPHQTPLLLLHPLPQNPPNPRRPRHPPHHPSLTNNLLSPNPPPNPPLPPLHPLNNPLRLRRLASNFRRHTTTPANHKSCCNNNALGNFFCGVCFYSSAFESMGYGRESVGDGRREGC